MDTYSRKLAIFDVASKRFRPIRTCFLGCFQWPFNYFVAKTEFNFNVEGNGLVRNVIHIKYLLENGLVEGFHSTNFEFKEFVNVINVDTFFFDLFPFII